MRVIDILPLSRGIFRESLSYFTGDEKVLIGSIVSVPVRKRQILGLVTNIRDPRETKVEIKSNEFSLRKMAKLKGNAFVLPEFIQAAEDTACYFASGVGVTLANFLPKAILESPTPAPKISFKNDKRGKVISEVLVLQAGDEERFSEYKSLIRERFARNLSVYLCFPTTQEAEEVITTLDRGIKEYSFVLHTGLSKGKIIATWKAALSEPHPVLIIGTGAFLSIPRSDIGTIIIEREASRFYKLNTRPYADVRVFALFLAKRRGIELVMADSALRVETLYKAENGEYAEFGSTLKFRSLWGGTYKIVDMRRTPGKDVRAKFEIVSTDLKEIIRALKSNNEKLFIFSARRGLSPLTVCGDCGTVVNCTRCSAPITLHRESGSTFFLCHHCGERRSTEERCRVCGSWKLETLGIGAELVEETIKKEFGDVPIFRLDKDTAKTRRKADDIAQRFYKTPGSILLGTEFAVSYLREKIQNSAIVSIDSLFSLPDFRINERIFSLLLAIRSKTEKRLIIQTRNIEASVLGHAAAGTLGDFYREELRLRKVFNYPPFSVLIKISFAGKREAVEKEAVSLEKFFEGSGELEIFPAFVSMVKGKYIMNALIKLPRSAWPDEKLLEKLKQLPPYFKIEVDPENIL